MDKYNSQTEDTPKPPKRKHYIERSPSALMSAEQFDQLSKEEKRNRLKQSASVLMSWPNWDVWPFKIATPVLALASAAPGFMLNSAFRSALLLGHFGRTSSYLATMGIPSAMSGAIHNVGVTTDILEQKTKCPVCLQVRSASLQFGIAFIYPAIIVPIANFSIASGMKNLYFPKIHKQPREVWNYAVDIFKTVKNQYFVLGAFQIVLAMGLTHFEQTCFADVVLPILTGEKKLSKETHKVNVYD